MVKFERKPGHDDCLRFDGGLTVHCPPWTEGELLDPVGVQVCINARLHSGSSFSMMLPLKSQEEVNVFISFIARSFREYNKEEPSE